MGATAEAVREAGEERRLLALAQAGDERAFRELVEPHRRALEVHCYRMLGSPHDAEDVVQETLMRAWRKLERFEGRASLATWLYRIATNACLDELERRPRRPEPVDPYPDERLAAAETPIVDPAARYAAREGVELAFLTAIQRLPGRQRAILILRDVLGWTAPEVADLLDSTVAAVNSGLQRARATIDAELPASSPTAAAPSQRELLADYVDAWERTDIDGLVALLREDAVLRMPPEPAVVGAGAIGEFFDHGPCGGARGTTVAPAWANGRPAVVMRRRLADGSTEPHGLLVLEVEAGAVVGMDAYIDIELVGLFSPPSQDRGVGLTARHPADPGSGVTRPPPVPKRFILRPAPGRELQRFAGGRSPPGRGTGAATPARPCAGRPPPGR